MKAWFLGIWNDESRFRVFARSLLLAIGGLALAYPEQVHQLGLPPWFVVLSFAAAGLLRSKSMTGGDRVE